jgi:hypothetical protein
MSNPEAMPRGSRETRLLLVTIAVSIGVLLLLARFRFPDEAATQTVSSAPAPLERLAARAVYDELSSTMADLERRIVSRIAMVQLRDAQGESLVLAPRLTPDRAVALVDMVAPVASGQDVEVVAQDEARSLVVLRVPAVDDGAVTIRQGTPRAGPRYVAVVETSTAGPIVRPVYVARVETRNDAAGRPTQLFTGLEEPLARGSAIFTLEGAFLGLVRDAGRSAVVVPAETLPAAILNAQPAEGQKKARLGVEVNALTPALMRATGADHGVMVVRVLENGPAADALQSGDVIRTVDGTRVTSPEGFRQLERSRAPGAVVALTGIRRREPLELSLRAVAAQAEPVSDAAGPGFVGRNVPGAGIEVVSVADRGAAAAAGLSRGDLIVAIDGESARDVALLTRRFRAADEGFAILLTIERNQQHRVLALEKR